MSIFLNNYTTIRNKCSNFVHKIQYKGMKGKRYSNSFTSSGMVKEEGRAAYYKLLESVRDGDTIRIKRGVYATAEQLADTMIDVGIPHCREERQESHAPRLPQDRTASHH